MKVIMYFIFFSLCKRNDKQWCQFVLAYELMRKYIQWLVRLCSFSSSYFSSLLYVHTHCSWTLSTRCAGPQSVHSWILRQLHRWLAPKTSGKLKALAKTQTFRFTHICTWTHNPTQASTLISAPPTFLFFPWTFIHIFRLLLLTLLKQVMWSEMPVVCAWAYIKSSSWIGL